MKSEMVRFTWGYREERVIFEYFGLIGLNLLVIINKNGEKVAFVMPNLF